MQRKSIRFSLTLWYALTLVVILTLFSTFHYFTVRDQLYRKTDGELLTIAEALASPTFEPFRQSASSALDQVLEDFIGPPIAGKIIQLYTADGREYYRSRLIQGQNLALSRTELKRSVAQQITFETLHVPGLAPVRSVVMPIISGGITTHIIRVGVALKDEAAALHEIFLVFIVSIPLALLLISIGGWFLAGRALRPIEQLIAETAKISDRNLSYRLAVSNPDDEIGRLAEAFNRTLGRLESSFKRVRQFSADVSHELRTPLTILRGETEVGLKWGRETEELREVLNNNLEEIKRMSTIVEFLLELSRVEGGEVPLATVDVDLVELLQDLLAQVQPVAEEKGVALSFQAGEGMLIQGDLHRLRQIFVNLLENAIKYTPLGGSVSVEIAATAEQITVAVSDTGAGIAAEDLPFIFDRFYRVEKSRNRAVGGYGLGLSLVKSLTEAHGGRIEVVSEPDRGSTFTVYLPRGDHQL